MAAFNLCAAFASDRLAERGWVIVGCLVGSASGMALLAISLTANWPLAVQYFFCFLLVFYSATSSIMIAWLVKALSGLFGCCRGPGARIDHRPTFMERRRPTAQAM